ncbi:hypothetical protein [Streptomyces lydicus]|uniref:hypothetical protein n=1 Tax=Streptomyces lydicus TaxID=47763 RepID=UPI0037B32F8A
MDEINRQIVDEVAGLQASITSVLQELEGLPEDHPRYEALFEQLLKAGSTLLAYEAEVPAKQEEPHRKVSEKTLTWSSRAHGFGGALLALTPLTGWIGWGWVALAAVQLVASFLIGAMDAPVQGHRQLRVAAVLLGGVTVLVPLVVLDVLSGWFWVAIIAGWIGSFGVAADAEAPQQRKATVAA